MSGPPRRSRPGDDDDARADARDGARADDAEARADDARADVAEGRADDSRDDAGADEARDGDAREGDARADARDGDDHDARDARAVDARETDARADARVRDDDDARDARVDDARADDDARHGEARDGDLDVEDDARDVDVEDDARRDDDDATADDRGEGGGAPHRSVLPAEVVDALAPASARTPDGSQGWWLDGTLGAGGHSALLLAALPAARLIGLDRDPHALELARARLAPFGGRALLVRAAFADAPSALDAHGVTALRGALLDLGVSSMQLDQADRGFSFSRGGPLDMRMDPAGPVTARDLVHTLAEDALADVIYRLGEDRLSRRIARAIVRARQTAPLSTTADLADIVRRAVPPPPPGARRIHPATRTFQALRMAVNDELGQLERALPALFARLAPGGRLAVISFHSLEDRAVKTFARARQADGTGLPTTRKPIVPGDAEVAVNPRARSAKLRVIERVVPVAAAPSDGPQPWRRKKPRRA